MKEKSQHVTNCTVGITGLERESKRREGVCEDQGQQCVSDCMNIYVCVASSHKKVHCFSFMDIEETRGAVWCYLVFQGETPSLRDTEMPKAYQNETPASDYFTSRRQSVPSANFIKYT